MRHLTGAGRTKRSGHARAHALAAATLAVWAGAALAEAALTPGNVTWCELHFHARKFIFTADTTVKVELISAEMAVRELAAAPGHAPVMPADAQIVRIDLDTTGLGRHTHNTVWIEPMTGAALQTTSQEFGRRARYKTERFTDAGVAVVRNAPASGEEGQPADRWTKHSNEFIPFPDGDRQSVAISDSVALFWILATCPLAKPGDVTQVVVASRDQLVRVKISVAATRQIELDFDEHTSGSSRAIKETVAGLELTVTGSRFGHDAGKGDLEFVGFRGAVRILLDPTRRVPVEISGSVPMAGTVTVRLQDVTALLTGRRSVLPAKPAAVGR